MTPRTDAHTIRKGSETVLSSHIESHRVNPFTYEKARHRGRAKGLGGRQGRLTLPMRRRFWFASVCEFREKRKPEGASNANQANQLDEPLGGVVVAESAVDQTWVNPPLAGVPATGNPGSNDLDHCAA